ncbi:MAG: hypothetical protein KF912_02165 [Phycisphaeraceae bacterium]|nr:hypothetical protein [Phycisphaeraceae bacterium]MBX3366106.1 hypothetical protein [Phycisphaeraceae bacterium]QYK48604.1 MAG: hypothetical protein KF838_01830 [Phycisphaeraceae bacterium]
MGVKVLASVCCVLIAAMIGLIVVSSLEMGLIAGLRLVAGSWWGITTLADLGVGLLFVMVWLCLLERRVWARVMWVVAVCMLGNLATLVFLLIRCRDALTVREVFLGR